ncbi:MAG TPA: hypothetical protein VN815_11895 [Steroidobacteraceae bacterium]|nr:hypothetical protein [Steroidobacteraceae bacterium]
MSNEQIPWWELPGAPGENRTREQYNAQIEALKKRKPRRYTDGEIMAMSSDKLRQACLDSGIDPDKAVVLMDAATERGKRTAAARLADDLDRLCCAETEKQFFDYVAEQRGSITALLRAYARS